MKKIPAVIVQAASQADRVEKLVEHCRKLDGTELVVLEGGEGTRLPYPKCNDAAFHQAAAHFKGEPFLWMEPDAIPLKRHWRKTLSAEYAAAGKDYMISGDSNPPYDIVGGIGIYGPNTHWLIPKTCTEHAWDMWMIKDIPDLIHRTPLIQHSYGRYFSSVVDPHRFPRDAAFIRPDAVLFHRDRYQELIEPGEVKDTTFRHSGDIGDILASLPILRHIGGGKVILCENITAPKGQHSRESLKGARYEAIKPLLEVQPYVYSVEWEDVVDSNPNFRAIARPKFESLTERQARHSGHWPVNTAPWLTVPEFTPHDRVICCRSPRYHNPNGFPWKDVVETYKDRILFIGLPDEHKAFEEVVGRSVEHAKTPNFLEIAKLMAGAPQVVANQSSPLWVALGLGCKVVCEGSPYYPNSQLPRPGSFWAYEKEHMDILRKSFAKVRASR